MTTSIKLSGIPSKSGIYTFKDLHQKVLYVGKAKNLRNRIKSYFQKGGGLDVRKEAMMKEVKDLAYVVTGNELEAFVLEANLIKQYKPKFNVVLRDDKSYPYLKLSVNEEWPGLEVVRKVKKDGALYFGPYVPAGPMWETLAFIRRNFRLRDCHFSFDKPMRPCIQHQMGRCMAPCAGKVRSQEYLMMIDEVRLFLNGKRKDLIGNLENTMQKLSEEMKFEEAAKIRDRIRVIETVWETQKIVSPELGDLDIIGFFREDGESSFQVFFIRNGIMTGTKDFFIKHAGGIADKELMYSFISQFYAKEIIPPAEIIVQLLPWEPESLEAYLKQRKGGVVKIVFPKRGKKKELAGMAQENALLTFRAKKEVPGSELLREVKERLKLRKTPKDIGAFDISNTSGSEAVGAFIYWAEGSFQKDLYRRLKIRTVQGADDYSMMTELIDRIVHNIQGNVPDLLIIDGGKGHLETARKVIEKSALVLKKSPDLIAIAKGPDRAFLTTSDVPVNLEDRKQSSLLLRSIRDEAHRFAIGYHRKLRDKALLQSPLEMIPGIGKKRRLQLLKVFVSIEDIKKTSVEKIAGLQGFNRKVAEKLLSELRRDE
jgi:excinuclease ABC subunit C